MVGEPNTYVTAVLEVKINRNKFSGRPRMRSLDQAAAEMVLECYGDMKWSSVLTIEE